MDGCQKENIMDGGQVDYTDENAPKVINSKDIDEFSTHFYVGDSLNTAYNGFYEIEIKEKDGKYNLKESKTFKIKETISSEELSKIQEIIDKYELVKFNGIDKVTSGLPYEYGPMAISVKYKSNEALYFRQNNDPDCEWTKEFVKCIKEIFIDYGHDELIDSAKELYNFVFNFTYDGHRYNHFFLVDENEELKLARTIIDGDAVLDDKFIDVPQDFNAIINDLINRCDLYSFNTGTLNFDSELYKKDFYEFYIDFTDGSQLCDYSNEDERVQKFNLIKEDVYNTLNSFFE